MLDFEQAKEISQIENVFEIAKLKPIIFNQQRYLDIIFIEYNDLHPEQAISKNLEFLADLKLRLPGISFRKLMPILSALRAKKEKNEIDSIRSAIQVFNEGFYKVLSQKWNGRREFELQASLETCFQKKNCPKAFPTIVASGKNALCLHYTENNQILKNGDLILLDAGCSFNNYACDVSRTFPVSGKFSSRQAMLYQMILDIQEGVFKKIKAGISFFEIQKVANTIFEKTLIENNVLKKGEDYKKVTIHSIGHSLGIDVHDPLDLNQKLTENSVLTIEPGIYLAEEKIGIRIEDNILIKKKGIEILTEAIPKSISEIEKIMSI